MSSPGIGGYKGFPRKLKRLFLYDAQTRNRDPGFPGFPGNSWKILFWSKSRAGIPGSLKNFFRDRTHGAWSVVGFPTNFGAIGRKSETFQSHGAENAESIKIESKKIHRAYFFFWAQK